MYNTVIIADRQYGRGRIITDGNIGSRSDKCG